MTQNGTVTTQQGGELTVGTKIGDLRKLFDDRMGEMMAVMDDITLVRRFIMVTLSAAKRSPKLLECTRSSILMAVIDSMTAKLEPSGILGQAAIVPFFNKNTQRLEAQFMPMYQGLIDLAYRSDIVDKIEAHVVYNGYDPSDCEDIPEDKRGDIYHYQLGDSPYLTHKPNKKHKEYLKPDAITDAYAIAWLSNGQIIREPMDISELLKIKKSSAAGEHGPWSKKEWFEMMCRKSPIKRLYKFIPKTVEMRRAIAKDDSIEAGDPIPMTEIDPSFLATQNLANQTKDRIEELKDQMGGSDLPAEKKVVEKQEPPEKGGEVVDEVELPIPLDEAQEPPPEKAPEKPAETPQQVEESTEDPAFEPSTLQPEEPAAEVSEEKVDHPEPQKEQEQPEEVEESLLDRARAYQRINIHWGNRFKEVGLEKVDKKVKDRMLHEYLETESLKDVDDERLIRILNGLTDPNGRTEAENWIKMQAKIGKV